MDLVNVALSVGVSAVVSAVVAATIALALTQWKLGREARVKRALAARELIAENARKLQGELNRYTLTNDAHGAKGRRAPDSGFHVDDVNTARPMVVAARDLGWWRRTRANRVLHAMFGPVVIRMAETYEGHDADWLPIPMHGWGEVAPYVYDTAYRTGLLADTERLDKLLTKLVRFR